MDEFNGIMNSVCDRFMGIFAGLDPIWPLVVISAIFGIAAAVLFRYTTHQPALKRASEQSKAAVLAIRLFPNALGTLFGSLARLFWHSGWRILHTLPMLLLIIVPTLLLLVQLAAWYEFRPLETGDATVVEVTVEEGQDAWKTAGNLELIAPAGVVVETPMLRDPAENMLYWRIRVQDPGRHRLAFQGGDGLFEKEIIAGKGVFAPVSPQRTDPENAMERLLFPREAALPKGAPVKGIEIHYPPRVTPLFGWDIPWWVTLLVVSILGALAMKPFLRIHF